MNDREWLEWLDKEIWEECHDRVSHMKYCTEKRQLTTDEFSRLKRIAGSHEFIVEPHGGQFGFGFGLSFYQPPANPGVPADDRVFTIVGKQVPGYSGGPSFKLGWETLSPLSHNPANEDLLKFYGFDGLREASHYDY
jgi:hypothetical protein